MAFCVALLLVVVPAVGANDLAGAASKAQTERGEKVSTVGLAKVSLELIEKIDTDRRSGLTREHYRIYVNLHPQEDMSELGSMLADATRSEALAQNIREIQDRVVAAPIVGSAEVMFRYETVYGFSALADEKAIHEYAANPDVSSIEEMPILYKMDAQSLPLTNTDDAHAQGFDGDGVTIVIIDDGIDHDHAAFGGQSAFPNSKILGGRDFADNDNNPRIDCTNQSHGTAVSGVAAGNGGGITGSAKDAKIVFLKIQSASICGQPSLDGDIVGAIDWAVANRATFGIKIISMSLGGGLFSSACDNQQVAYRNAINAANAAGITVLAASGNDARSSQMAAPACVSGAISVGATYDANIGGVSFTQCSDSSTFADKITCYSNSTSFLDILAPAHCANTAQAGGGTNTCFGGTSSATPFAAGIVANLLDKNSSLSPTQIRNVLTSNGVNITDPRNGVTKRRVDAIAALNAVGGGGGGTSCPATMSSPSDGSTLGGASQAFSWGACTGALQYWLYVGTSQGARDILSQNQGTGTSRTVSGLPTDGSTVWVRLWTRTSSGWANRDFSYTASGGGGGGCDPFNGSVTNLSGASGSEKRYQVDVPACASEFIARISGGSGDADLYVKFGSQPTTSSYDCRPFIGGNNETCTFDNPGNGRYYIMIRGYSAYSGVRLDASYD